MGNITSTELGDSIATVIAANALGYLKANTTLARLVARDWDNEVAQHGQTIKIPFTAALSVNDKSANTVVTLQTPNDTVATLTLNKHKEVSFLIEDFARALARPDYLNAYLVDGMAVLAEQIDSDIAALYSGLSQTIDATMGLDESHFREARRQLNAAKAPLSQRFAVLGEDAEAEFLAIDKATNRDYAEGLQAQSTVPGGSGRFMGFDVFMDQKINSSGGQIKNLFFQRNALCIATRPLPAAPSGAGVVQKVMDEDGFGLRVTVSFSPDYLGVQTTIDVLYGVAELRDNHGVAVSTTDI